MKADTNFLMIQAGKAAKTYFHRHLREELIKKRLIMNHLSQEELKIRVQTKEMDSLLLLILLQCQYLMED